MISPTGEADFGFWFLTIPKNSEKKLELENKRSVYHVSNATLGNKVSGGRTTLSFKSKGKTAPICNLVNNTLETASLDLIVSKSMNASFMTKGPNAVTVSGYIQPLVDDSDNDSPELVAFGADGEVDVQSSKAMVEVKASDAEAIEEPVEPEAKEKVKPKPEVKEKARLKEEVKEAGKHKPKEEAENEVEVKEKPEEQEEKHKKKAASAKEKESLKRKLDEAKATDVEKPSEKKRNKKKSKMQEQNQKAVEEASVNSNNGAVEPMQTDEVPKVKSVVDKNKSEIVKVDAESSNMEVEEASTKVAKQPAKLHTKRPVKETPVKETQSKEKAGKVSSPNSMSAKESSMKPVKETDVKETPTKEKAGKGSSSKSKSAKKSKMIIKAGKGVTYRVLKKGKAGVKPAKKGDSITLLYVGCLKDGTEFDKNLKNGLTFKIGGEQVIPGIELGVMGMCPKEKRRIIIPSDQGYGEDGASEGKIPPNAELHFTVQRK